MGGVMEVSALLLICFQSGGLDAVAAGATTERIAKITVRCFDYAAVPYKTSAEAEREASRIFRQAGVDLLWMECGPLQHNAADLDACEQVGDPVRFVVKILPENMAVHLRRPPRVFGMAVQRDAFIFFDRIQIFSATEGISEAVILGHAMAHELGHMVLRQTSHSSNGIMMETFRKEALRRAEKGHLLFSPQQAATMRAHLRAQTVTQK